MKASHIYLPAKYATNFALGVSGLALLGWLVDHQSLSAILPGIAGMTFNTALSIFVLALVFLQRIRDKHQPWHPLAITTVALLAGLSLVQDVFAISLSLDQFFVDSLHAYAHLSYPGRMSPLTATGLLFACLAYASIYLLPAKIRFTLLADMWIMLLGGLSLLGLAMHYFLQQSPHSFSHFSSISLFTALCLLGLSFSLLYLLIKNNKEVGVDGYYYFGTHLMYRLSYPKKFLLISLIFALPITVLVHEKTDMLSQDIAKAELKIKGLHHIALLSELLKEIPEHRGMEFGALHGFPYYQPALQGKAKHIQALFESHHLLDEKDRAWINNAETPEEVILRWKNIQHSHISPQESWSLHTEIIALLNAHMTDVGHDSKLIYESNETLNNLIKLQLIDMPMVFELAGQIRGLGTGYLAANQLTLQDKITLSNLVGQLRLKLAEAEQDIAFAFTTPDEQPQAEALITSLLHYKQSSLSFLNMIEREFLQKTTPQLDVQSYFNDATHVLAQGFTYSTLAQGFIDQQLQQQIESLQRTQYTVKFLVVLLVMVMFYLFMTFYRSIITMVEALEASAKRMKDGDMQPIEGIPHFDEMGKVVLSFNTIADALRKSTSHIKAIVDHSVEGIITTDNQANITSFNPAAAAIFGYSEAEVLGKNMTLLMPESLKQQHLEKFAAYDPSSLTSSVLGATLELTGLKKDGVEFTMEMSLNAMELEGERLYLAMFRDISTRQALEVQLRQAQKMEAVGVLAGGIAHNFNNMMMALTGRLYIAKKYLSRPEKVSAQLDLAGKTIEDAKTMVSQLLTFARKDFFVSKDEVDLTDIVRQAYDMARLGLRSDIDIELHLSAEAMRVYCDVGAVQQIVMNLINNAYDATAEKDKKSIAVFLDRLECHEDTTQLHVKLDAGQYACLTVRDNGSGIKKEHLEQIFEPYFTTKPVGEGTGLGLSTIFGTVESHGGKVDVLSEVGEGTSFLIYLPLISNPTSDSL